jgi:hypothetical protein
LSYAGAHGKLYEFIILHGCLFFFERYYLPNGERMGKQYEKKVFCTLLIIFIMMMSSIYFEGEFWRVPDNKIKKILTFFFTLAFNSAPLIPYILLVVLLICIGIWWATLYALRKLRRETELAYIIGRNHAEHENGLYSRLMYSQESVRKTKNM